MYALSQVHTSINRAWTALEHGSRGVKIDPDAAHGWIEHALERIDEAGRHTVDSDDQFVELHADLRSSINNARELVRELGTDPDPTHTDHVTREFASIMDALESVLVAHGWH